MNVIKVTHQEKIQVLMFKNRISVGYFLLQKNNIIPKVQFIPRKTIFKTRQIIIMISTKLII